VNKATSHPSVLSRAGVSGLRVMCALRAILLGAGLSIGLITELLSTPGQLHGQLVGGAAALFLLTTLTTYTPAFRRSSRLAMATIGLLDIVTLLFVFHLPEGTEVVESFIAVPAIWLGVVLGRRGVALTGPVCAVLFVAPGLVLHGTASLGWHQGISIVAFALLSCGGLVASAEMWATYAVRLEVTAEELRRALVVKEDFISLVSHELRTPLTSIIGYLDLAMEEAEELPGSVGAHLNAVSRNADRLLVLVTDLLAAEQAEREPMHLVQKPTNISSLAQHSLNDLALRAETAEVSITSDIEPGIIIYADSTRILQVVDNLLSNAVKYTPPTGDVTLTLRRESDHVLLEVSDTGIGIHAEDLPGLFTKFFRARNATDLAIPGIGLGLMITRIIVEAHGGTIEARSQEGVGTSMRVCLPLQPRTPEATIRDSILGAHLTPAVGHVLPIG
jgi:signal transduction histidine kinase